MADPPTPFGMTVDLTDAGIYPYAHRSDEGRFAEVGTETGPEVVVQVRPAVECARVKRQPMSYDIEEGDKKGESHNEKEEQAKSKLPRTATGPGIRVSSRYGQRT